MGGLISSVGGLVRSVLPTTSMFRKGSSQSGQSESLSQQQSSAAQRQVRLAEQEAAITRPLRTGTANILGDFLKTGETPGFLDLSAKVNPLAALSLPGVENERNLLRERAIGSGTRGGQLQQQLFQADLQGGLQRTGLLQQDLLRQDQRDTDRSQIRRTLFGGAADAGTGGLALALQGMGQGTAGIGSAAGNLNALGLQRITQNQIAQEGIGKILGKFTGAMSGPAGGGISGGTGSLGKNAGQR